MLTEPATVEYRAHDHQLAILESEKRVSFLGAGVASGKTDVGTLWTEMQAIEAPHGVIGLIAANTYDQLFDATLRNVFKNLDHFGIAHRPRELPKSHSPITLEVWNGRRWVEILCRSMERFENLSGVELGWAWMDEVWQTPKEAFDIVIARVRDRRMRNRILLTSTLDDPTTWMYETFVEKYDEENMLVVYATTYDNESNLPPGYIDSLKTLYSPRMFERMVMAKWVSLEAGQVYYSFSRAQNVSAVAEFDPALPILWTLDFNIGEGKPMSSCLCQIKKGPGPKGELRPELHVFDEIILETSDTNDAVTEFKSRPWLERAKAGVRIYGDASGSGKDTRSKVTDYEILRQAGFSSQKVPLANPPIRDRHNAVNRLLKSADGDVRTKIHPRCRTLATGLETVILRGGAQYLEKETRAQHVTTALGYLIVQEFPFVKPQPAAVIERSWG